MSAMIKFHFDANKPVDQKEIRTVYVVYLAVILIWQIFITPPNSNYAIY